MFKTFSGVTKLMNHCRPASPSLSLRQFLLSPCVRDATLEAKYLPLTQRSFYGGLPNGEINPFSIFSTLCMSPRVFAAAPSEPQLHFELQKTSKSISGGASVEGCVIGNSTDAGTYLDTLGESNSLHIWRLCAIR
jgi:hypothetical protein